MRPFSKFLLNFLMDVNIPLQNVNLLLVLGIFKQQFLSLLRLELKFVSELRILKDGQPRCSLKLVIVQSEQISFSFLDFVEHFFAESLSCLNLISFLGCEFFMRLFPLFFELSLQINHFLSKMSFLTFKFLQFLNFLLHLAIVSLQLGHLDLHFLLNIPETILIELESLLLLQLIILNFLIQIFIVFL